MTALTCEHLCIMCFVWICEICEICGTPYKLCVRIYNCSEKKINSWRIIPMTSREVGHFFLTLYLFTYKMARFLAFRPVTSSVIGSPARHSLSLLVAPVLMLKNYRPLSLFEGWERALNTFMTKYFYVPLYITVGLNSSNVASIAQKIVCY